MSPELPAPRSTPVKLFQSNGNILSVASVEEVRQEGTISSGYTVCIYIYNICGLIGHNGLDTEFCNCIIVAIPQRLNYIALLCLGVLYIEQLGTSRG